MFDQIFERSDSLRRQFAGPLREARLAYLRHRAEQVGTSPSGKLSGSYLALLTSSGKGGDVSTDTY